jgi:hypothetical protein
MPYGRPPFAGSSHPSPMEVCYFKFSAQND